MFIPHALDERCKLWNNDIPNNLTIKDAILNGNRDQRFIAVIDGFFISLVFYS